MKKLAIQLSGKIQKLKSSIDELWFLASRPKLAWIPIRDERDSRPRR